MRRFASRDRSALSDRHLAELRGMLSPRISREVSVTPEEKEVLSEVAQTLGVETGELVSDLLQSEIQRLVSLQLKFDSFEDQIDFYTRATRQSPDGELDDVNLGECFVGVEYTDLMENLLGYATSRLGLRYNGYAPYRIVAFGGPKLDALFFHDRDLGEGLVRLWVAGEDGPVKLVEAESAHLVQTNIRGIQEFADDPMLSRMTIALSGVRYRDWIER